MEPVIKGRGHVIGFPEAPASKQEPDAIFRALIHLIDCFSSSSSSSSSSAPTAVVVAAAAAEVNVVAVAVAAAVEGGDAAEVSARVG